MAEEALKEEKKKFDKNIPVAVEEEEEDTQKDKYLSFSLADEDYAIEIKHVNEIIGMQKFTEVPNVKRYIKGIINLRGNIIPVVDVRTRFKVEQIDYDDRTSIIVVMNQNIMIGLIVDEVSEVLKITEDKIASRPQTNKGSQSKFIQGVGKVGEDVKIILDLQRLLFDEDTRVFENREN